LDLIVDAFPNSADIELNAQYELFKYQELCFMVFHVAGRITAQDTHVQDSDIQEMGVSNSSMGNGLCYFGCRYRK